jgi:hypothetical protein
MATPSRWITIQSAPTGRIVAFSRGPTHEPLRM